MSAEPPPKANPKDAFQSVWYRVALFVMAVYLTGAWSVLGPSNPLYALALVWGTSSLQPTLAGPLMRALPRQSFRVPDGERALHRLLGVGLFWRLLDVIGWNRLITQMRAFSGTKAGLGVRAAGRRERPQGIAAARARVREGERRGSGTLSPYETVLGPAFASLHAHVRRAHLPPLRAEGTIDVEHGRGALARAIIRLMKLPAAGLRQPVHLEVTEDGAGLVWTRRIGAVLLQTRQRANGTWIDERSGLGRISFALTVEDGALRYQQTSFVAAGLPVPRWLGPSVSAVVSPTAAGWHVEVTVTWRGQAVCRYAGAIRAT